jgi:hypothetical protein
MILGIKLIILVSLIRLLLATESPLLCAGLFTGAGVVFGAVTGNPFLVILIAMVIRFALASLYFWLLSRTEGFLWWIILICGLPIGVL